MIPDSPPAFAPRIELQPEPAQIDQPVTIRLAGFNPGQELTLHAQTHDDLGRRWNAHASFQTDPTGTVDLQTMPAITGSYTGIDPMGLFWSMIPEPEEIRSPFARRTLGSLVVNLTVYSGVQPMARLRHERRLLAPDVHVTRVNAEGLVGLFFRPARAGLSPVILVLGGSSGGLNWSQEMAALLAAHGFATLALAYFGMNHLPQTLEDIPLEYFASALAWLERQEGVAPATTTVIGRSKGAELALLLGAMFDQITAVIAYAPSSVVWVGVGNASSRKPVSSWSYRGKPLPYLPFVSVESGDGPVALTPGYLAGLKQDDERLRAATIPVERIKGPVLLISGGDDQMWPSGLFAGMVMQRLAAYRHPYPDRHLQYPDAGHLISYPYLPTTITHSQHTLAGAEFEYGGSPAANAAASSNSWRQVLRFLYAKNGNGASQ